MKALVCEMCGSPDLVKTDGMFVCQNCGTKYTVEEAKKMMVEGTVQIDNSAFVEKYLANARRARTKGDWAEVEKYYNLVEQNATENIEAIFYSAYGKLRTTLLDDFSAKWDNDIEVVKKSISVLDDYFDMDHEPEQKQVIIDAMHDILMLTDVRENHIIVGKANTSWGDVAKTGIKNRIVQLYPQMNETIDHIILKYKERGIDYSYLNEIKDRIDRAPQGCYVATCVYGSYDCPQVWTLRRFRDSTLAKTWYGRALIHVYYSISPTLVRWFGNTAWFKKLWKGRLDHMVELLNEQGIESTPYHDKQW
ncbi:MAG TPA: hypothetical protein DEQ85_01885 [Clostridiales bacterium]|nr:hypothetical protein [Clostridiales bacterium]